MEWSGKTLNRKYGKSPNVVLKVWPWATLRDMLLFNRCRASLEPKDGWSYWGRCELVKDHICDHAIERGFSIPQWQTKVTGM